MKNFIKNILLILFFTFTFKVNSQNSIYINSSQYNTWQVSNNSCYGCGSFYIMVTNTKYPNKEGFYYYDIYLWSNSFYTNGYASSSYVKNINLYAIDPYGKEQFILNLNYALVPPKSQYFNGSFYLAYVYSISARQTIKLTWTDIEVW